MQYRNTTAVLVTIKLAFYASTTGMDNGGRTCTGTGAAWVQPWVYQEYSCRRTRTTCTGVYRIRLQTV